MIIFQDTNEFSQIQQSCVATIGKFDGVHLGHQLILDQLKQKAEQFKLPSLVILIEPHPEEFFAASVDDCPARLTDLSEKLDLLKSFGIDFVFQLAFTKEMSELSAEDYIKDILVDGLGVASLIIGHDFKFGYKRGGDFALLKKRGAEFDFEVIETAAYERNGQRISSTIIREQLAKGDFCLVEQLLGRPYSIRGKVVQGKQLGTDLGFPTCNINPQRRRIPLHGVFACEVKLGDRVLPAAVNIGYRPTLGSDGDALLEVHILDFNEDLYDSMIEVVFKHKIREEEKFADLDTLTRQISADVDQVREVLGVTEPAARP